MLVEYNVVHKNPLKVDIRFGSCYPNFYSSAMSSLGYHIVYDFLNSREDVYCERVIYPEIHSIETNTPLNKFEIIGFSLQYEQDYFNVLKMLQNAQIPLDKQKRSQDDPLIIGGGPCASSNPLPLTRFFDIFLVGEAETMLDQVLDTYLTLENPRKELDAFQEIEGVYVPDNPVKMRLVEDGDDFWHPIRQVFSENKDKHYQPAFGKAFLLGVSRGCARGCRFCMAGCLYRPRREVNVKKLVNIAERGRKATGLSRVALIGAAVADHSQLELLCQMLHEREFQIALPSLRVEAMTSNLLETLKDSGLRTLTLAPESTWRLRKVVNKPLTDDDIFSAIELAYKFRFNVKLYFLVGLPTETSEDLKDLNLLIHRLNNISPKSSSLRVSVNPFIPKAHTPFQWTDFHYEQARSKLSALKDEFPSKYFKIESARTALKQYVLSLSGPEIGEILENSTYKKLSIKEWKSLTPHWDLDSELPWKNIHIGISTDFLKKEYHKALAGDITPWCEVFGCYKCGSCQ